MIRTAAVCLVTAVVGPVDEIRDPVAQSVPVDCICYTDQDRKRKRWQVLPADAWKAAPEAVRLAEMGPNLQAKWYKWQTHKLPEVQGYEWIVWVDGSIHINDADFVKDYIAAAQNGLTFWKHPKRDCAYAEAYYSMGVPKYKGDPLAQQVEDYRAAGFPEHYGLWAVGLHAKRRPETDAVMDALWAEILARGRQDQVSVPYALWQQGIQPGTFDADGGLYWSKYFRKANHLPGYEELGKR